MTTPEAREIELVKSVVRLTEQVAALREDMQQVSAKIHEAISTGAGHRAELDRRLTRLESQAERFITWKHLVMAAGGSGVGAGGIVAVVHQLLAVV